jgi:hypothetical protein
MPELKTHYIPVSCFARKIGTPIALFSGRATGSNQQ